MAKPSPLPVTILPASEADCLVLCQIRAKAFENNDKTMTSTDSSDRPSSLSRVVFGSSSQEVPIVRAQELAEKMRTDPTVKMFKAVLVDEDEKKIVAWAQWHYYLDPQPVEEWQEKELSDIRSPRAYNDFFGSLLRKRNQYMGGKRYAFLETLVTLPEYQGLGIGSRLIQAGLDKAEQDGLFSSWLEATEEGYALYRKFGFRDLDVIETDLTKYGGTGTTRHVCMLRSTDPGSSEPNGRTN